MKYKYKIINITDHLEDDMLVDIEKLLNRFGDDGWRLFSIGDDEIILEKEIL